MPRQTTFADLDYARKKRPTRREIFLSEMEAVGGIYGVRLD
jgi:hypothetical protein